MIVKQPNPRWLGAITLRLGQPEYDITEHGHRWQWLEGDCGVRIDQRTHAWEVFAWNYMRSAMLRTTAEPSAADVANAASLAGLTGGPHAPNVTTARFAAYAREAS